MENINDSYFDGYYKDIWRSIIPAELTKKEIDFMVQHFDLHAGSQVLDIMCGYGRHAIALAEKRIAVTAVDNLGEYIDEIRETATKASLPITAINADASTYQIEDVFDLAICMGNSLNFFPEKEARKILENISSHLKKGGCLFINTWSIAEIAIRQYSAKSWNYFDNIRILSDSKFLFNPTRIETETFIITPDNKTEKKTAIDYIFSISEVEKLLNETGFIIKEIYSIPGKKKFTIGEPRAYIVAIKE